MPHTPGHKYTVYGTGENYTGRTVKIGGELYTTVGGALEGNSLQVVETQDENIGTQPTPTLPTTPTTGMGDMDNPIIATFVRGDGSTYDRNYYLPISYNFGEAGGQFGNPGGPVISGTPLHVHEDGTVMTQHSMAGIGGTDESVIVTVQPPLGGQGTRTSDTTIISDNQQNGGMNGNGGGTGGDDGGTTPPPDITPPPGDGGGMNQGGGNY